LPREDLTLKEKATLYGMTRFPGYNDRELSEVLNEKMSTVTSIRRRLKERGVCFKAMVPSFRALGCEVISLCYGGISSGLLIDMKKAMERGLFVGNDDSAFFAQVGTFSWLELGAFPNFSSAKGQGEVMWKKLNDILGGVSGQPCLQSYYPLDQMRIHNFFDYTGLLSELFHLDRRPQRRPASEGHPTRKLSHIEKLVFYGLVKHPDVADKVVAEHMKVSRQAVARIRKLLIKEGFLFPLVIPNLEKLGHEILVYFRFHLNPRLGEKARAGAVQTIVNGVPNLFSFSTSLECVAIGAFCTFPEFEKSSHRMIRRLEERKLLEGAPDLQTYLLPDTVIVRNHDYVPLVKNLLELDIEG